MIMTLLSVLVLALIGVALWMNWRIEKQNAELARWLDDRQNREINDLLGDGL